MKTYWITFKVDARFECPIDADSMEEALEKAEGRFADADFGEAVDIDGEAIMAEDEHGNIIWEK